MKQLLIRKSNYSKSKKSIIILAILMLLIGAFGRIGRLLEIKVAEASQIPQLRQQIQKLDIQARVATVSSKPVRLSGEQIKRILTILMPKEKNRNRFMAILKCENDTHDPKRININKDNSYDLGVAQINSKFHTSLVKDFFGQDFDEAMQDPVKNLVYSVYLYQHQGFTPWVCNQKVVQIKRIKRTC